MTLLETIDTLFIDFKKKTVDNDKAFFSEIVRIIPHLANEQKKLKCEEIYQYTIENSELYPLNVAYGNYVSSLYYFFTEDYETFFKYCNEAFKIFLEQDERDGIAVCSGSVSSVYRTLGNMELGLKYAWEARKQLVNSIYFPTLKIIAGYVIAGIYYDMYHYDESLSIYQQILAEAEALHYQLWIANSYNGIGNVFLAQKNYPEAKLNLEKGLAVIEKMNLPFFVVKFITDLGTYYSEVGDYVQSAQYHQQALSIREERNFIGGAVTNLSALAEIKQNENKHDEAIALLNRALQMAEQVKIKPKIFQIHQLLSVLYQQKDDLEKTLHHYKLFHEIKEEVEKEDAAKKVKNLQLIFETEQIQKENIIIKAQKAEIEKKNTELQETIDELTITKVSKKAKAITLLLAFAVILAEDPLMEFVHEFVKESNFFISFAAKVIVIFSMKPIERGIEHYLLKKIVLKKKHAIQMG